MASTAGACRPLDAGVLEEAAFRGYMQAPIERRHGPLVGMGVVAVVFTLAHLGTFPDMSPGVFMILLLMSVGYGLLTFGR